MRRLFLLLACSIAFLSPGCSHQASSPVGIRLDGTRMSPVSGDGPRVLIFVRSDCPIANRYAPELRRLHLRWQDNAVPSYLVYPDKDETAESITTHLREYDLPFEALRDPEHALVAHAGATVTPEAAVYQDGRLRYRGRIDDRFVDFGKARAVASQRDLEQSVDALLGGKDVSNPRTQAVGCFLGDLP